MFPSTASMLQRRRELSEGVCCESIACHLLYLLALLTFLLIQVQEVIPYHAPLVDAEANVIQSRGPSSTSPPERI